MNVRFDGFEFDYDQRCLFRDGVEVRLSPKALNLLRILVGRAPNAVSKQDLYDLIWPATFVSETNLPGIAVELRTALDDDARHPRYIRTVHGFGYAFAGPLQTRVAARRTRGSDARFRLSIHGREISLGAGEHLIGRTSSAPIFVDDASVSREHAVIANDGRTTTLHDLASKNGTFVNGQRISESTVLRNRDVIGVGSVVAVFRDGGAAESTETVRTSRKNSPAAARGDMPSRTRHPR